MDSKRGLGLITAIVGVLVIAFQSVSITGAVINASTIISNSYFAMGLALVVGGIVLFISKAPSNAEQYQGPLQKIWHDTTQFLAENGLDYRGRGPNERSYMQDKFEGSMKTGAFSSQRKKHH